MDEENVFTAKTVDEAIEEGLKALSLTLDEANITVLEEGKKKLFGVVKARVKVEKKASDAARAAEFVEGLLGVLNISSVAEIVGDGEDIRIDIKSTHSARVIGKHGDVLDAIQTLAGAVANMGRDEYKKVLVDCENYRAQREETLKKLAERMAEKAVEKGRKLNLEPMSPYERRIIHSALAEREDVKTVSEGKEPARYISIIPNNAKPFDKGLHYGERRDDRRGDRKERRGGDRGDRGERRGGGAKRGKKEIYFGAFLGNSGNKE